MSKVLLLEFNEICPSLLKRWMDQGKLPNFSAFYQSSQVFTSIADVSDPDYLEPWIQWYSIHTGLAYDEHKVFYLTDGPKADHPDIWRILGRARHTGGNVGKYFNGTDASDYGSFVSYTTMTAGSGQIGQRPTAWKMTVGDHVKNINIAFTCDASAGIDQLDPTKWYNVMGPIDNSAGTFYIENPATPGVAFLGFTRHGVPITDNSISLAVRPQYAPATGYFSYNYTGYGGEIINALKILGYNVNSAYNISIARGMNSSYNSSTAPSQWWDVNVIVP